MPYINASDRDRALNDPHTPGELNFALTRLLQHYMRDKPLTYTLLNECLGALEAAKLEYVRRVVVPYEDSKMKSNGDVYA